ncbi:MAG: nucleotidyl transferase AbiEii/AbiGii toxin family protein [Phycisphaerae bacterium]|nr:nucleotidyl transferase AbiEii/AbiGii toxin family protein [Phycisphaerae bacterium]
MSPNVAASVKQRLLNLAKDRGEVFDLTLVRYACGRFLYRLSRSDHRDRFVLKGAMLFLIWTDQPYRATRDVDLLGDGSSDPETIGRCIAEVCGVECPEDGLSFDTTAIRVTSIREEQAYEGLRVELRAFLGRTRIPLQIDIGFGDAITPSARIETCPTPLDLPAPRLKVYPMETVIAEKLEAMVRFGIHNSRMKDFYDVAILAREFGFDGGVLRSAVANTLTRRGVPWTGEAPDVLGPALYQDPVLVGRWTSFLAGGSVSAWTTSRFDEIGDLIRSFLTPIWDSLVRGEEFRMTWKAGGPWAAGARMKAEDTRRFKPYPEYRASGVEWLGEIPRLWEVKRLKTLGSVELSNVDKKSIEGQESVRLCNYTDVYYGNRISRDIEFMSATATPEQVRRFSLQAGDVLITKDSESWTDIAVPAVLVEDLPGVLCGYHLAHIRPGNECDGSFLSRAFEAVGPRDQFQIAANGITRFGLGRDAICTGLFAMPPLNEQQAIAAFLDRETAKIDALVAKKERLIELLQEKRTALISDCVTGKAEVGRMKDENGNSAFILQPSSLPMKASGVEWLGEIPAHWEVRRLKFVVAEALTYGANESAEVDDPDLPRFIRITDINDDGSLRDETVRSLPVDVARPFLLKQGDLLFARSGATVGKTFMYRESWGKACHAGYLIRCRTNPSHVVPEFLSYFATSSAYWGWLSSVFIQATIQNVSAEKYANLIIPLPPPSEQLLISDYLDHETARLDALTAKVRTAIDHLKEYRAALISAAVTGKIDVRGEVA